MFKRLILADDHAMMRSGMASYLERRGYTVVGEAECYQELNTLLDTVNADAIISDCKMPGGSPLDFLHQAQKKQPNLAIIFLTGLDSVLLFDQLLHAGAKAILSKKGAADEIEQALIQVSEGKVYLSHAIAENLNKSPLLLTPKEFQVFELIVRGESNAQISEILNKSASTINTHRVNLMRKLEVNTVVELVHFARDCGLYDHD